MNFGTRLRRTRRTVSPSNFLVYSRFAEERLRVHLFPLSPFPSILQPNQTPLGNGNCLLMITLSFKPGHRGCTNCDQWFHKFDLSFIYLTLIGEYFDRRRVKHSDRPTRITVTAIEEKSARSGSDAQIGAFHVSPLAQEENRARQASRNLREAVQAS